MLTKEYLLMCDTPPNIRDVSLELYKEFAEEYLLDKIFHYTFLDGTELNLEFTEWGNLSYARDSTYKWENRK